MHLKKVCQIKWEQRQKKRLRKVCTLWMNVEWVLFLCIWIFFYSYIGCLKRCCLSKSNFWSNCINRNDFCPLFKQFFFLSTFVFNVCLVNINIKISNHNWIDLEICAVFGKIFHCFMQIGTYQRSQSGLILVYTYKFIHDCKQKVDHSRDSFKI